MNRSDFMNAGISEPACQQKQIPAWSKYLDEAIAKLEYTSESFSSVIYSSPSEDCTSVENSMCILAEILRGYTLRIERINKILSDNQL
jgi:hypothetical protein